MVSPQLTAWGALLVHIVILGLAAGLGRDWYIQNPSHWRSIWFICRIVAIVAFTAYEFQLLLWVGITLGSH